jgi:hypothetical protein
MLRPYDYWQTEIAGLQKSHFDQKSSGQGHLKMQN